MFVGFIGDVGGIDAEEGREDVGDRSCVFGGLGISAIFSWNR